MLGDVYAQESCSLLRALLGTTAWWVGPGPAIRILYQLGDHQLDSNSSMPQFLHLKYEHNDVTLFLFLRVVVRIKWENIWNVYDKVPANSISNNKTSAALVLYCSF